MIIELRNLIIIIWNVNIHQKITFVINLSLTTYTSPVGVNWFFDDFAVKPSPKEYCNTSRITTPMGKLQRCAPFSFPLFHCQLNEFLAGK